MAPVVSITEMRNAMSIWMDEVYEPIYLGIFFLWFESIQMINVCILVDWTIGLWNLWFAAQFPRSCGYQKIAAAATCYVNNGDDLNPAKVFNCITANHLLERITPSTSSCCWTDHLLCLFIFSTSFFPSLSFPQMLRTHISFCWAEHKAERERDLFLSLFRQKDKKKETE